MIMNEMTLSIIIPAYNEEERLGKSLKEISGKAGRYFSRLEIIVVDDGSNDRTVELAEEFMAGCRGSNTECRVIRLAENRGKGHAVKRRMLEASSEIALMTDADLSTPIEELERIARLREREEADIVIGSRALVNSDVRIHQPWYREYGGKAFNLVVRAITWLPFRDTQCGFKLFKMSSCREIFEKLEIERFAFDVEILFIARSRGLKVIEEPVIWRHSEGSKVKMIPDSVATFFQLLRIRANSFRGRY